MSSNVPPYTANHSETAKLGKLGCVRCSRTNGDVFAFVFVLKKKEGWYAAVGYQFMVIVLSTANLVTLQWNLHMYYANVRYATPKYGGKTKQQRLVIHPNYIHTYIHT